MELVEPVTDFSRKDWEGLVQSEGGGVSVVSNEAGCEAGEEMGERCGFLI